MTPDSIAALSAAIKILESIGTWPIASTAVAICIGPWIMSFILSRGQERRFEAVKEMYKENVSLVEGYEKTCKSIESQEQELRRLIQMNTQAMTSLTDVIRAQRCNGNGCN